MTNTSSVPLLDPVDTFSTLCNNVGLDVRLRKALSRLGYVRPTLVQSKCLPLAIQSGRDLLVRARTGSGKTLAYCLPILQKILNSSSDDDDFSDHNHNNSSNGNSDEKGFVKSLILVPTRELCTQVSKTLKNLIYYCDDIVSVAVLSGNSGGSGKHSAHHNNAATLAQQQAMLRDEPNIIVSTPAGLLTHLRNDEFLRSSLKQSLQTLVVDEADLVLSFGYSNDIHEIMKSLPKICQGFIMSATLSTEITSLKKVVLHSPAVLKLEDEGIGAASDGNGRNTLSQFYLPLPKRDKFLVLYVFLKLGLLKGKGLFFVNTTDGGYRLKLFLEQFHIRSAVLNAELPLNSRLNIIEQYNVGNFDYLIATDESTDARGKSQDHDRNDEEDSSTEGEENKGKQKKKSKQLEGRKDSEYGVSRGLDFHGVSFVVNVDFPPNSKSYTHRVGRTARGGAKGVALSLVELESVNQFELLNEVQDSQPSLQQSSQSSAPVDDNLHTAVDDVTSEKSSEVANTQNSQLQPSLLDFDLNEIEGFRYRVEDVSRAVTKIAVKETRAAELRAEILNSQRLQSHFEESSADLQLLRHDRQATHVSKVQDHLKHVPKYLLPRGMQVAESRKRKRRRGKQRGQSTRRKDNDPLQSYESAEVNMEEFIDDTDKNSVQDGDFDDPLVEGEIETNQVDPLREDTGKSTAGRVAWKQRHGKGEFSKKKSNRRQPGKWH
mmetsp:Transcript_4140/g.5737  ORF Transcript_4140/g.5737 Transcript_4140/m.5737 type:complete len:716 (+) Transcript_4140:181-2328(+)